MMTFRRISFAVWLAFIVLFMAQEFARAHYIRMIPPGRVYWGVERVWPGYGMRRIPQPYYGGRNYYYWRCRNPWRCGGFP